MSIQWVNWVLRGPCEVADPIETLILLMIAERSGPSGGAWPSVATMVKESRLTERTVQRTLRRMEEKELIRCIRGGGRNRTNKYEIICEKNNSPYHGDNAVDNYSSTVDNPVSNEDKPRQRNPVSVTPRHTNTVSDEINPVTATPEPSENLQKLYIVKLKEAKKGKEKYLNVYKLVANYTPNVVYCNEILMLNGDINEWEAHVQMWYDTDGWNHRNVPSLVRAWNDRVKVLGGKPAKGTHQSHDLGTCFTFSCRRKATTEAWGDVYCTQCYEQHKKKSAQLRRAK